MVDRTPTQEVPTGQRSVLTEMALYTVKDGKIVREQFFYNVPEAEA
jgi:ketosteroid isomerase-like protein